MTADPLHLDPLRPALGPDSSLENRIGTGPHVALDTGVPLRYDDLEPSTTYVDERFEYLTDDHAMPARVRGVLQLRTHDDAIRHPTAQAEIGRLATATGRWHGGHIVAVTLGGFASGPNVFPQSANFNQSAFARLEHGWRDALRDDVAIGVDIALTEGPDFRVPEFVLVTYWEGQDLQDTIPLLNEPNAQ
ncbi:MAG: hypothetical protein GY745_24185 [Actinomycetia bacterium]|nr:hypothetical protein [Actinomycetes bacterium]